MTVMTLNDLIIELEQYSKQYGNLYVSDDSGYINELRVFKADDDSVVYPPSDNPTQLILEFSIQDELDG